MIEEAKFTYFTLEKTLKTKTKTTDDEGVKQEKDLESLNFLMGQTK